MPKKPTKKTRKKKKSPKGKSDGIFGEISRPYIVSEVVRYQRAKRRSGTAQAKTRSFISRSGIKPFAQKGTGRARQGDVRSPILEGGGVIFPPESRDYSFSLTKKARKTALRSVLSEKKREGKVTTIADHGLKNIKTKEAHALVSKYGDGKVLFVLPSKDEVFEKSVRNLPKVKALRVEGLNVYDVLNFDQVVFLKEAITLLEKRLM